MLIWTRSQEDWAEDQALFQGYKGKYVHIPCLQTNAIPFQVHLPERPFFLAFTSAKGSDYFLKSKAGSLILQKAESIFAIGKASAEPLLKAQYHVEVAHSKNGRDFQTWILERTKVEDLFLLPGPRERAFDLAEGLKNAGRIAKQIDIYNTLATATTALGAPLDEKTIFEISLGAVACFASPSAVEGFSRVIAERTHIVAICMGDTTAARASGFNRVCSVSEPTVGNLFAEAVKISADCDKIV